MPTPYLRPDPSVEAPARPPLVRVPGDAWLGGVCAAVARHLRLDVVGVRWGALALGVFGAGIPVYLFLWALIPLRPVGEGDLPVDPAASPRTAAPLDRAVRGLGRSRWGTLVTVGLLVLVVGLLFLAQSAGVNVRAGVLVPLLVITVGAVVAWSHLDAAARDQWLGTRGASGMVWVRVMLGLALAVVGLLVLVVQGRSIGVVWDALVATVAVLVGAVLIAAPWVVRLWQDFRREQIAAALATERADIAAHLHDSVLQTLALIQRNAADPGSVTRLARVQERELRSWLYNAPVGTDDMLASAVSRLAAEIEDLTGVPVELVVTGDRPLERDGSALVRAMREALLNATRHGRPPVTAYVEIGPDGVAAFVRDRGDGFDLETVPADRLGVRQSILGRMERHGGSARVRHREDGTEVELSLPAVHGEERP
jgi:signal transduction histidine kinase/phage shock protein PspC (stress-responsive transcriptional regulator)